MAWVLNRFGTTILPVYSPDLNPVGAAETETQFVPLPSGGAYDLLGSEQAPRGVQKVSLDALVLEDTAAAVDVTFQTFVALRGQRQRLYRLRRNGTYEWALARLVAATGRHRYNNILHQPISLKFEVSSRVWNGRYRGYPWYLDSGEYLDAGLYFDTDDRVTLNTSPKTATVTNNGDATAKDIVITLTAGSVAITAVTIQRKIGSTVYEHLTWTGTLASGKALVIDCGARTVKNDGADAYSTFALGASHQKDAWLNILPGSNTIEVTITGGSTDSTISFSFREAWE